MEIRRFVPGNYDVTAEILSRAYGGYTFDAQALQELDESLIAPYVSERWLAWQGPTPIGVAEYRHTPEMFHPREFLLTIAVDPMYRGKSVGKQLYDFVQSEISAHGPVKYRASCREDNLRSVTFLRDRGFVRGMHILELELDLAALLAHETLSTPLRCTEDVEIVALSDLSGDEDRDRKLFSLITALRKDASGKLASGKEVELAQPSPDMAYEYFQSSFMASRSCESSFVAIQGDKYVGFTDVAEGAEDGLINGLTGVLPQYRRRGIAGTLKSAAISFATARGYRYIKTFNDVANEAILSLNMRLGYTQKSAWLHFEKTIDGR